MYNEWISFRAKSRPDHVAVVVPTGPVRYGEFDAQIDKVVARLAALRIRAGGTASYVFPAAPRRCATAGSTPTISARCRPTGW
jgi:non-ribosomal peptide synthetase component E (peptide arylation enzyme)